MEYYFFELFFFQILGLVLASLAGAIISKCILSPLDNAFEVLAMVCPEFLECISLSDGDFDNLVSNLEAICD